MKSHKRATLQGTNISPKNGILKMIFLFPRWDMLIPWRVIFFSNLGQSAHWALHSTSAVTSKIGRSKLQHPKDGRASHVQSLKGVGNGKLRSPILVYPDGKKQLGTGKKTNQQKKNVPKTRLSCAFLLGLGGVFGHWGGIVHILATM